MRSRNAEFSPQAAKRATMQQRNLQPKTCSLQQRHGPVQIPSNLYRRIGLTVHTAASFLGPVIPSPRAQLDPIPVSGQQRSCVVSSLSLYSRVFSPESGSIPLPAPSRQRNHGKVNQALTGPDQNSVLE